MKLFKTILAVGAVVAMAVVQASGQERFRTMDFTNAGINVQYVGLGTNQNYASLTNPAGAAVTGSGQFFAGSNNLVNVSGGGNPALNNWFNIQDWYNTPVTFDSAVYQPGGTNGAVVFQLTLAHDIGGIGSPPQAGINPLPMLVSSNAAAISNNCISGTTNLVSITYPTGFFTNWHWAQWSAVQFFATNSQITNAAGYDTNGLRIQKFRASWFH